MQSGPGLVAPIIAIGFCVLLFLIFRVIVLWYWRVNEAIALLKSIDDKLGTMATRPIATGPYIGPGG